MKDKTQKKLKYGTMFALTNSNTTSRFVRKTYESFTAIKTITKLVKSDVVDFDQYLKDKKKI